ncbi:MAG: GMC family oxidoreductase N-terminal domain-containing protein [Myxococcota bacterium]|nr:GMC family oxidoreductase N-terminal domain-containing protein [Myxococcota bacterium]MDW8362700.1 GMC family oxidoreductase N-terminal domain-containing protein [Myxococcales bacterium]
MSDDVLSREHKLALQRLFPLVLGLDARDPQERRRIETAVERLDDFLCALPGPRDGRRVTQMLVALDVLSAVLYPLRRVHQLDDRQLQDFFARLFDTDRRWRANVLDALNRLLPDAPTVRDLARGLREIVCLAYYSQPAANAHTRYVPLWDRAPLRAVDPTLATDPGFTLLPERERLDLQAIAAWRRQGRETALRELFANDGRPRVAIVGSGPGGSTVAARLAATGRYDVAVFEQGPRFWEPRFPLDPMAAMALLYDHGLLTPTRNLDVRLLRARVVGGGSTVNIGLSVPIQDRTLDAWVRGGIGFRADQLRAAYDSVADRQRFVAFSPTLMTDAARLWRQGLEAMGGWNVHEVLSDLVSEPRQHDPTRPDPWRKGDRCLACGMCNYGCRFAQHRTVDRTFLRDAEAAGARVHPNTRVKALVPEWDPQRQRIRVGRIVIQRGGEPEVLAVDHVVLAAGAVGSPALLLESGKAHALWHALPVWARVGRHFGLNYGTPVLARFETPMQRPAWNGIQVSYRVDRPGSGHRWMLEAGFLPPGVLAAVVPGVGRDHREWMGSYDRLAMAVNTIGTPQSGRVREDGEVAFTVDGAQMALIHETLAYLVDSYLHAGATQVRLSGVRGLDDATRGSFDASFRGQHARILERIRRIASTPDRLSLASGHPQGGMRMNASADRGVVGADFRVHGTANLWVSDASLFPSTITVNLQWTVMALGWLAGGVMDATIQRERRR